MSHTCVSCALEFSDVATQRSHMKSDWHRYNLKRRVAQLPAISESVFNEKIAVMTAADEPEEEKHTKRQVTKKDLRRQQKEALQAQKRELLAQREALQAKYGVSSEASDTVEGVGEKLASVQVEDSKLPQQSEQSQEKDTETDTEVSEEQLIAEKLKNRVEIPVTTCLFCPKKNRSEFHTLEENLHHMFKVHGLYIPEKKYLIDAEGLVAYLGEKIGLGNVCLVCSYQGRNVEAVREHMLSKRHMKIPYESQDEKLEISDFYDFTSTYGESAAESTNGEGDDGEWEDVSGDENDENDENDEEFDEFEDPLINMGTELILPSGAVVGHRSMAKYYKQVFPPEKILSEGQGTVIAAETRHFADIADKQQLQQSKRVWAMQKKREDTNDRRAQKYINNQPHFRDPLLQ